MAHISYGQKGYSGTRMSKRAEQAYSDGERPLSKWTKTAILDNIKSVYGKSVAEDLKTMSAEDLKRNFLIRSSWHHTGSYASRTDFYMFDEDVKLSSIKRTAPTPRTVKAVSEHWAVAEWTEWTGTKKHPKPVPRLSVISWTETNGKPSMVTVWPERDQKRLTSFRIVERLKEKPRSNAKVWSKLY